MKKLGAKVSAFGPKTQLEIHLREALNKLESAKTSLDLAYQVAEGGELKLSIAEQYNDTKELMKNVAELYFGVEAM